jgi:hypothetical protein
MLMLAISCVAPTGTDTLICEPLSCHVPPTSTWPISLMKRGESMLCTLIVTVCSV